MWSRLDRENFGEVVAQVRKKNENEETKCMEENKCIASRSQREEAKCMGQKKCIAFRFQRAAVQMGG